MTDLEQIEKLCLYKGRSVEFTLEDVESKESDNYVVLKKLKQKVNNKYYYYYLIKCKKCGTIKKICSSDWINQKVRRCIKCASQEKRKSMIGYENTTYKVISINFERTNNNRRRIYYNVICKNCGAALVLRSDAIKCDTINGKCIKCRGNNISPTDNVIYNIQYNRYKQNAILRNFNFDLTKDEFNQLISSSCYYCGERPKEVKSLMRYNKTGHPIYTNGIDRIDSTQGYTINNVVPCCEYCNRMKLDYTLDFFYNHIEKIHNHHKSLTTIPRGSTSQANGDGSGEFPEKENDIV